MANGLRCLKRDFFAEKFNDDGFQTASSIEQQKVEDNIEDLYRRLRTGIGPDSNQPALNSEQHVQFLKKGLSDLSSSYECLDASRPWLIYWIFHSLELLEERINENQMSSVCKFLANCQHEDGGFGGGPGHLAHLAPTYAAVNSLCIIGTDEAFEVIDRPKLLRYLLRMKTPEGAFKMHDGGEIDIRGAYCAASAAALCNIKCEALFEGTAEWVVSCQSYEGGFSGAPGMEAHGGYTFCGLAALIILGKAHLCDIQGLLRWAVNRQMRFEGGFQGRTNKLVDGCYSFWQGGSFPLIHSILTKEDGDVVVGSERWLFNQGALQEYLLICCQSAGGGLIDKPGQHRDFYHTCYALSGLSVAQHFAGGRLGSVLVVGKKSNELLPTHPVYNICLDAVVAAHDYFKNIPYTEDFSAETIKDEDSNGMEINGT